MPAKGHSGGILVCVKDDILQVEEWKEGEFFVEAVIRNRLSNFRWCLLVVYGPANHDLSLNFLQEMSTRCEDRFLPLMMGGDFNLIRSLSDKSSGIGDRRLIDAFNDFKEGFELRELHRTGGKYTWSNKQLNPVLSNIDRILVSTKWEDKFPLCTVTSLTRVGSDHCPLLLNSGEERELRFRQFFFEKQWFKQEGFIQLIKEKWEADQARHPDEAYSLDKWHKNLCLLR